MYVISIADPGADPAPPNIFLKRLQIQFLNYKINMIRVII